MQIGIAYDLKADFAPTLDGPEDLHEEYDSEDTVAAIEAALHGLGHQTVLLGGGRSLVKKLLKHAPDLVFNIAEGFGTRSREAHVPSVCEMLKVAYTHSDPLTLAVTLVKAMAKRLVAAAGVDTPRFVVIESPADMESIDLQFPVIAKPLWEGSSMGIRKHSRAVSVTELQTLVTQLLLDYSQPVLVEEFCNGPEFTVGILENNSVPSIIGVLEIRPRLQGLDDFIYSLEVKRNWRQEVEYLCPPQQAETLVHDVEKLALAAFKALSCRDVARVDIRVGSDGRAKFLEVNPLPGLNPITGDLPILARHCDLSYGELIGSIVDNACMRQGM